LLLTVYDDNDDFDKDDDDNIRTLRLGQLAYYTTVRYVLLFLS